VGNPVVKDRLEDTKQAEAQGDAEDEACGHERSPYLTSGVRAAGTACR
jgi:hypothetical protein